jgi:hypothetical protein
MVFKRLLCATMTRSRSYWLALFYPSTILMYLVQFDDSRSVLSST